MNGSEHDKPGIIAPPPLVYVGVLAAGLFIDRTMPLGLVPERLGALLGWPLIASGGWLFVWSLLAMRRAGTSVNPYKPTAAIVVTGPYRYSRNPIYLGDALIYFGITFLVNSAWPAIFSPLVWLMMRKGVIAREERYLERKFGEDYRRYKHRVRRWL